MKDDAEYQRRKLMSKDERAIQARDGIARDIYKQEQLNGNSKATYEQAHRKATEIANKVLRREQDGGN